MRSIAFITVALLISTVAAAADTLVVCPLPLQHVLGPWIRYRQSQGHEFQIISPSGDADAITLQIHQQARQHSIRSLLLVGDTPPVGAAADGPAGLGIATHLVKSEVSVLYGSEAEIATDNPYADLDGDGIPDIAVGRLPVNDARQLSALLQRVISYEKSRRPRSWQGKVHFIAGVGGFGLLADKAIEAATRQLLGGRIPATYHFTMTFGSWRSPFCPDPRQFHRHTLARLNEGSLFWVYLGHGSERRLDRVVVPGKTYHILDSDDLLHVDCRNGPPIAVFLSCYTASFDGTRQCLAEQLLQLPQGPIAVYGGSRVTMPYAMAVMGESLMRQVFDERRATLGELILQAKRDMVQQQPASRTPQRRLIDVMAAVISPRTHDLQDELEEHLSLFNLLGDPLLRIPYPEELVVACPARANAGDTITVKVTSPFAGTMQVELRCGRDQFTFKPPQRTSYQANDSWLANFEPVYKRANNPVWWSRAIRTRGATSTIQVPIPDEARGACSVRIVLEGRGNWAAGSSPIYVRSILNRE